MNAKKITLATFKKFIKENRHNLFVRVAYSFDGMVDGMTDRANVFTPAESYKHNLDHTLGILGVWLVGQSRDRFKSYRENGFEGIEVNNACGRFMIATSLKK